MHMQHQRHTEPLEHCVSFGNIIPLLDVLYLPNERRMSITQYLRLGKRIGFFEKSGTQY